MNSAAAVDWLPALAVLAVGLVAGAVLAWRALRAGKAAPSAAGAPLAVRDLEGKRDALVNQLRELEDTASKRAPAQLARERYALELEAAHVLLALGERDRGAAELRAAAAPPEPKRESASVPQRAGLRGFLWGMGTAAAILLLAFFVYQSAKPREAGGSLTGELPASSRGTGAAAAPSQDDAQIQAALARNPNDVEAHLALARAQLARRDLMSVWNEAARVLELAPGNPQALTYQAVVRLAMGQHGPALDLLQKAIAAAPDSVETHAYLAMAYAQAGRLQDAEAAIAAASKRFPQKSADFERLLADLKKPEAAAPAEPSAATEPDPHASVGSAPKGSRVAGTVDIDPSLKSRIPPGAALFVFARKPGGAPGPPVAAKRLPATFPARFELSEADSMMGEPFPESIVIEARLSQDGVATSRSPDDAKARLEGVRAGRTDVRLVLKRP